MPIGVTGFREIPERPPDACVAEDEPDFDNPGELALTTLDLVQTEDGGWALDVAIGEVSGRGNFNYPGFSVEAVDGSAVLTAPFSGPDTLPSDRVEQQGYGAAACDVFGGAIALSLDPGAQAKLKLVAWTDLGETVVDRFDSTVDHDDYTQVAALYGLFDDAHRDRLTSRIAGGLGQARQEVQMRALCHFFRVDEDYGRRIATKLGVDVDAIMQQAGEMVGAS